MRATFNFVAQMSVDLTAELAKHGESVALYQKPLLEARADFERRYLTHHMKATRRVSAVAKRSGLNRTDTYKKLKARGVAIPYQKQRATSRLPSNSLLVQWGYGRPTPP